jgi:hypothetical protein
MQRNFRGRMFRMFIVNANWLVRGLWSIAKTVVDEFTLTKMNLHSDDFKPNVLKFVDPSSLETKYGGTIPDKETNFFPPEMI